MKTRHITIATILLLSIAACTPRDEPQPAPVYPDMTQISPTDEQGQAMGAADPTDWTYDATWTDEEHALMMFADTINNVLDTGNNIIQVYPAYPNPSSGLFSFYAACGKESKVKLVLVDSSMHSLRTFAYRTEEGAIHKHFGFHLASDIDTGNYRMYYGFYNSSDSLYYKGHGDIKIE